MARPRMQPGEWGTITLTPLTKRPDGRYDTAPAGTKRPDRVRARARVRGLDGRTRTVERIAGSRAAAERALRAALAEYVTPSAAHATLTGATLVKDAAEVWWAGVESAGNHRPSTLRVYKGVLDNHIIGKAGSGAIANLTLREVRVSNLDGLLRAISRDNGPAVARTTRTVIGLIFTLAVRHDAVAHNPVRSLGSIAAAGDRRPSLRDKQRAFTVEERAAVMALLPTIRSAPVLATSGTSWPSWRVRGRASGKPARCGGPTSTSTPGRRSLGRLSCAG